MRQLENEPIAQETLEKYYQSLQASLHEVETLEQTALWHALGLLQNITLVAFGLTVAPVLPVAAWLLGARLPGSAPDLLVYWAGGTAACGVTAMVVAGLRSLTHRRVPRVDVSAEQRLFMGAFEAYEALGAFALARQVRDRERAVKALRAFAPVWQYHRDVLTWYPEAHGARHHAESWVVDVRYPDDIAIWTIFSTWADALYSTQRFPWLRLNPESDRILRALVAMPPRVIPRIRDSAALRDVREVLGALSGFLYAYLPEHESAQSIDELALLHQRGHAAGLRFVQAVEALPDYQPAPGSPESATGPSWFRRCVGIVPAAVTHPSPLVRFAAWFGVIALLVAGMLAAASAYFDIDSGAAAVVFISSTTVAPAALAAMAR